jgi:hypothetical protein
MAEFRKKRLGGEGMPSYCDGHVSVAVECCSVNYSLQHSGLPVVESLTVHNTGGRDLRNIEVGLRIDGYTLPTKFVLPELLSQSRGIILRPDLPLIPDRMAAQLERARAFLEVEIDGIPRHRQAIWVLPYNECSWNRGHEAALAAFICPNNPAVVA